MILVDTSVWVEFFRDPDAESSTMLQKALVDDEVVMGDLILVELLQGLRHSHQIRLVGAAVGQLQTRVLCGVEIAPKAAHAFRTLRQRGVTIRGTIDVIIAAWCIENRVPLLHRDRDFDAMERHLGLVVWR